MDVSDTKNLTEWYDIVPNPQNEDGTLTYKFEYDILQIPENIVNKQYADEEGKEFETLIGDILIEVIQDNITKTESEDGKTRRYDIKEPVV